MKIGEILYNFETWIGTYGYKGISASQAEQQLKQLMNEARVDENNLYLNDKTRHYYEAGPENPAIPLSQLKNRIVELKAAQEEMLDEPSLEGLK